MRQVALLLNVLPEVPKKKTSPCMVVPPQSICAEYTKVVRRYRDLFGY